MEDDDLERLGNELAADEGIAAALDNLDRAWSPCIPVQLDWMIHEFAEVLMLTEPEDLQDIGSDMDWNEMNKAVTIMQGLASLMQGYGRRFIDTQENESEE